MCSRIEFKPLNYLNVFIVAGALLLMPCQPLKAQGLRIGFADYNKIVRNSNVHNEISAHSEQLIEQLREFEKEQSTKIGAAPPEQKLAIRESIKNKRANVTVATRINWNKKKAHLQTIREQIKAVAERNKLSLVFLDERTVILTGEFIDITDEVIARINENE
jgi:Skp family chaperone for outer membrane proteins